ncbi:hypothetical protein [Amycolatopsis sp. NPDC051071]|uniref:hypothetical protein n=1 Tax=Amycolatopsis sp. NPDC051071 TaxID=3154637 RepID=UPI003426537D
MGDAFEGVERAVPYRGLVGAELLDSFHIQLGEASFGGVVLGRPLPSPGEYQGDHTAGAGADGKPNLDQLNPDLRVTADIDGHQQHGHGERRDQRDREDDDDDRPPPCPATVAPLPLQGRLHLAEPPHTTSSPACPLSLRFRPSDPLKRTPSGTSAGQRTSSRARRCPPPDRHQQGQVA